MRRERLRGREPNDKIDVEVACRRCCPRSLVLEGAVLVFPVECGVPVVLDRVVCPAVEQACDGCSNKHHRSDPAEQRQ